MGREIRNVPPSWEHPQTERHYGAGLSYQPMFDQTFADAAAEWKSAFAKWEAGERPSYFDESDRAKNYEYWEWDNTPPDRAYYRTYPDSEATWFQVYETVSEGTPVSPPFATLDELVAYLSTYGDFWDQKRGDGPWSRANAEAFCKRGGWLPSMIVDSSGVHASKDIGMALAHKEPDQ